MEEYYIRTEGLSVGYNKKPVVENIGIRLRRGQILTLVGPNGAGKSTVLKSIVRQLAPVGGTVYLDGQDLGALTGKELAKKMSMVMTGRLRAELMTCEDVVSAGRYPYTGRLGFLSEEDKKIVRDSMALVHAEEIASCDFSKISDGQRQRILLARALCQQPEVVILDEPTSFLDIRHKLGLLEILKKMVRQRKLAVVMSLHEIDLAQKISDIVACIHEGKIEKTGAPEEIFSSGYIRRLYGLERGSYDAAFGCLEFAPVKGKPEVFVIGGNGSGIPVYRRLNRQGIPFAAGILHENDVDYPVAKALAAEVVTEQAYEPIAKETLEYAKKVMGTCREVIACNAIYGTANMGNRELARLGQSRAQKFTQYHPGTDRK